MNERAGRLRENRIGSLLDLEKQCKIQNLMHSNNRPFGKGKCKIFIYSELYIDRWVEDGRLVCPAEITIDHRRIFLVVVL